ncbi:MAG TPA: hypothetical protein VHE53_01990 [Patescibacteria group bacterium]|nr:hypothetical protein [Patescibacteria group bacterium]
MAARKKTSKKTTTSTSKSFFNRDLFIFIAIMAIVAIITYVMTYNAITAKINQTIDTSASQGYQAPQAQ